MCSIIALFGSECVQWGDRKKISQTKIVRQICEQIFVRTNCEKIFVRRIFVSVVSCECMLLAIIRLKIFKKYPDCKSTKNIEIANQEKKLYRKSATTENEQPAYNKN